MPKAKVVKIADKMSAGRALRAVTETALGPGLHAAQVERRNGSTCRVRLSSGGCVTARVADGVSAELVEECLRDRRTVLVTDGLGGPVIVGAVQVAPSVDRSSEQALRLEAREVELVASERFAVRVGRSSLELDADGVLRFAGKRLTIDVAALVRVLSAKVELP